MPIVAITLMLIGLDIVTGVLAAAVRGELSSKAAREGMMHKAAYLACILLALILDNAELIMRLGLPADLESMCCGYICMIETLSVVENIALINPELRGTALLRLFLNTSKLMENEGEWVDNEKPAD